MAATATTFRCPVTGITARVVASVPKRAEISHVYDGVAFYTTRTGETVAVAR